MTKKTMQEILNESGLLPETKEKIINLCKAVIPDATIWLYGSRANGTFRNNSDIDLALESSSPISIFVIDELKDILNASNIPHKIDVISIKDISDKNFKENILKNRLLWKK